jgi:hypothetical protein
VARALALLSNYSVNGSSALVDERHDLEEIAEPDSIRIAARFLSDQMELDLGTVIPAVLQSDQLDSAL